MKWIPLLVSTVSLFSLEDSDAFLVGLKIYQNECGRKKEKLTTWNVKEEFPSLGIGHFIWFTKDSKVPFEETFPKLVAYLKNEGVKLPSLLQKTTYAPWKSKEEFMSQFNTREMQELRDFLESTIAYQTRFIIEEFEKKLAQLSEHPSIQNKASFEAKLAKIKTEKNGYYALIDYFNFKGTGESHLERYHGEGWGLLQVIDQMELSSLKPIEAFVETAKLLLKKRVENAPKVRDEKRYLAGWNNRLDTYLKN